MNKSVSVILANAIIWASVIIAAALILKGTGYSDKIIPILGGGAIASILALGGTLSRR